MYGYLIPRIEGHEFDNVSLTKDAHKYYILCKDCLTEQSEKLNEMRRKRVGEEDGMFYSISSRFVEPPPGPENWCVNPSLLEGSERMRREFEELGLASSVRPGLVDWITNVRK